MLADKALSIQMDPPQLSAVLLINLELIISTFEVLEFILIAPP